MDLPAIVPDRLPTTTAGDPAPRSQKALRAVLRQEGAYVHAWVRDQLPDDERPRTPTDPRWLDAEVTATIERLWRWPDRRGYVLVWPDELARLRAPDLPPGVAVGVEGYGQGVLRRGAGSWSFVIDANLGVSTASWDGALSPWCYTAVVRAAARARAEGVGDLEITGDTTDEGYLDGATLDVRVWLAEEQADAAFDAAQGVFRTLQAPAQWAETRAHDEVAQVLRAFAI